MAKGRIRQNDGKGKGAQVNVSAGSWSLGGRHKALTDTPFISFMSPTRIRVILLSVELTSNRDRDDAPVTLTVRRIRGGSDTEAHFVLQPKLRTDILSLLQSDGSTFDLDQFDILELEVDADVNVNACVHVRDGKWKTRS